MVLPPVKDNAGFDEISADDFTELESVSTVSGRVVADEEILYAMEPARGKKGRFIPYAESKGKIKGIMPSDELAELLEDAVKKASELADEIAHGSKSMRPVKESNRDACAYCDYKDICRFKEK